MKHVVSMELNGTELTLETGRMAKLANASVVIRHGDTMVLVAVTASATPTPFDFLPLTVEYREKFFSTGKIPGGFLKRESRPSETEILSARLIDRPLRPMFPKDWRHDTFVTANVISHDKEHEADMLATVAASAALMLSSIPFDGPVAEVRVGRINGEFVINPRHSQLKESDMDMVFAGTDDSIVMVEGDSKEISEDEFLAAMEFGQKHIAALCDFQRKFIEGHTKEKTAVEPKEIPQAIVDFVENEACDKVREQVRDASAKEERTARRQELLDSLVEKGAELFTEEEYPDTNVAGLISSILGDIEKREMRLMILKENKRLDGRTTTDIRSIEAEIAPLPRAHGSALFTRGETQALGSVTLGTKLDEQMIDGLYPTFTTNFMLHYTFPPFSTNDAKPVRGTSRREIGHGKLAERALKAVLPSPDDFPYTIRITSDVLESNGSSSMATVCAGSLALFDAGVPVKKSVSGIAMGLIKEGDDVAILSDILGDEDFLGDMDFKVAGTSDGITSCQMDMKIKGISIEVIRKALFQAKEGRLHILNIMDEAMPAHRPDLSQYAPRYTTVMIPVETIGAVIGTGGETIRSITRESGATIDIGEDGKVLIAATSGEAAEKAMEMIKALTAQPEVGTVYTARIKEVREGLGAIIEFLPKKSGLLHISQIDHHRVENVSDVLEAGQMIDVKLVEIQSDGKFRFSRKALLPVPEGMTYEEYQPRPDRGGDRGGRGGDRGGRGGDRGGRGGDRGGDRGGRGGDRGGDRGGRRY